MKIDPEREITLTIPYGMVLRLKESTKILAMFRDEKDVRSTIEIIDAIHAGAMEFLRREDGDSLDHYTEDNDKGYFVKPGEIADLEDLD